MFGKTRCSMYILSDLSRCWLFLSTSTKSSLERRKSRQSVSVMIVAVLGTSCKSAMSPKLSPWVSGEYAGQLAHLFSEAQHALRGGQRGLLQTETLVRVWGLLAGVERGFEEIFGGFEALLALEGAELRERIAPWRRV